MLAGSRQRISPVAAQDLGDGRQPPLAYAHRQKIFQVPVDSGGGRSTVQYRKAFPNPKG